MHYYRVFRVLQYDRAILDFGNVTNSGSDLSTETPSSIIIKWDAVMIQNDNTINTNVYWISAGAEYNNENEIWVGQASMTARTDAEVRSGLGWVDGWMDGWMDGWRDGWVHGGMGGWMDGWMDE
jgi:hypothetical protein